MLIGSLIAVKGSSLIPRIWELETFSGEHKIERLAETEDKQPSNIPYPLIPFPKVLPPKAAPKLLQQSSPLQSPPLRSRPLTGLPLKLPLSPESSTEGASGGDFAPADTSVPVDLSTSLFIGDSRTEGLKEYGGLEEAEFLPIPA